MPWPLKITLATLLALALAAEIALRRRAPAGDGTWPWVRAGVTTLALTVLAAGFGLLHVSTQAFDPRAAETQLDAPFAGTWVTTGAGPTARSNHHHRIGSQRHAVDLARLCDDGRLLRGDGDSLESSCTWDADVLAPIDGEVMRVVDGLPDIGSRRELAGNHVVIRLDDARFVALAHLRQGSVRVAPGDHVRRGQPIGRAGASGNTDFPHLHVHVQDNADYDLKSSRSIPFRWRQVELRRYLWWRSPDSVDPLGNDTIRPAPGR